VIVTGRRKTIAFFIALGAGVVSITLLLYVGWVLLNWRTGILLLLGVVLLAIIIAGVVLNTIFLVREIRRNEQHDAFINAVTHELKTPVSDPAVSGDFAEPAGGGEQAAGVLPDYAGRKRPAAFDDRAGAADGADGREPEAESDFV